MEVFNNVVSWLNDVLWGVPMIIFLLGTHIILTVATKGVQRKVFKGIKLSVEKNNGKGDVSVFGALTTALASTVGTGNIIGVGTAITIGGPGAVLWTWLTGILGIATKYCETFIAVKHRKKMDDGSYIGGAMTALDDLKKPFLAKLFSIFTMLAAFGIGCGVQSNAIASMLDENFSFPTYITGIVLAVLTFIVIFGGIKSISNVCTKLVPIMSILYSIGCIVILCINISYVPETILLIVKSAFSARAMAGGFVGSTILIAMRYGMARGLFSNESGMGSAPIASAAGNAENAVKPAIVGSTGVFWDTVVICLLTGLVLCTCVVANPNIDAVLLNNGSKLCSACFASIPYIGTPILVFGVITFAYSTILGWNYYATQCVKYLFNKKAVKVYLFIWVVVIFVGSVMDLTAVWNLADVLNALMVIPNVIAVLLLIKEIKKDTNYYLYENHLDEVDKELI
ncbi:MAG: sodium:alanine symporter family protein [Erysipelotrichaceae bacterium]|nr:sodium:alanine symporter family protein [Erysipelotrichaceae bacterium]